MDIVEFAKDAIRELERSGISEEYRTVVLVEMIRERSNSFVSENGASQALAHERGGDKESSRSNYDMETLASRLGIHSDDAREMFLFDPEQDRFELTIESNKLPGTKKEAVQVIAILVSCFRQGLGIDEFTTQRTIAQVAEEYDVRDTNFSRHLEEGARFFQVTGSSRSRAFRLKRVGWEEAAKLVKAIQVGGKE